jgi:hypothetical protein
LKWEGRLENSASINLEPFRFAGKPLYDSRFQLKRAA